MPFTVIDDLGIFEQGHTIAKVKFEVDPTADDFKGNVVVIL